MASATEIMGIPAVTEVVVHQRRRYGVHETEGYMAEGFDASEPVYFIGGPTFDLKDVMAAQTANRTTHVQPCTVNLPGGINRLLLVDALISQPPRERFPHEKFPNYYVEGWMFDEGFNPATHRFDRVRMLMSMGTPERPRHVQVQRVSQKPDFRKRSRITIVERRLHEDAATA
ncbi:hypothetical protein [Streptomyces sp. AC555_RSS877]|uniref:hypothetical protein n=1 Tax=Streptomyces sp. AC555_RSS877 TaxID=2823688 RepID=UPI001C27000B|nr:hypothetical protein [Streptomyces sp. AC555_RSS877]